MLDDDAFVPADVVALTEWVSDYYLSGPGAALAAAMPPHGLTARVDAFKTVRIAQLTAAGLDAADRLSNTPRCTNDTDRDVPPATGHAASVRPLLALAGAPDGLPVAGLAERGIPAATLARLKTLGLVAIRTERVDRDPFPHAVSASGARSPRAR